MTSKQELRDRIALLSTARDAYRRHLRDVIAERDEAIKDWGEAIREREDVRAELESTRKQRDAAVDAQHVDRAEVVELRARVAELEAAVTTPEPRPWCARHGLRCDYTSPEFCDTRDEAVTAPEPRPFRVGDRVRVAEGATLKVLGGGRRRSESAGRVGVVLGIAPDGDLRVRPLDDKYDDYASPEFCTLIEPAPDDAAERATADQAAEQAVRIHLADGQVLEVPGALVEIDGEWWVTSLDDDSPRAWLNLEHVAVVVVR